MTTPSSLLPDRPEVLEGSRPTLARYGVLAFLCVLAFILYLDRICISKAAPSIMRDLDLSKTQMGFIFTAFTLAYGLFEVPTGHWADRIGSRRVLTRISIWWSIFTALTGACNGLWSLLIVRFLFGAGEAGAYPNAARIFGRWFPLSERGRAQGLLQFSALIGGAISPVVAAYLIESVGWRWSFVIFGATGIFWAVPFAIWFRDSPADHPSVNAAELALITPTSTAGREHGAIPWRAVARSQGILTLSLIMVCASFNSYIYFLWLPTYLETARGVSSERAGWLASMVLAASAAGNLFGAVLADAIVKRAGNRVRARQILGTLAYATAAVLLIVGLQCESAEGTAIFLALSSLVLQTTLATWWSCAIEISGGHVGALFGLMNGLGVFGAIASPLFFGVFADWRERLGYEGRDRWDPAFYVVAAILMIAALAWQGVDSSRPIDAPPDQPADA